MTAQTAQTTKRKPIKIGNKHLGDLTDAEIVGLDEPTMRRTILEAQQLTVQGWDLTDEETRNVIRIIALQRETAGSRRKTPTTAVPAPESFSAFR